MIDLRLSLIDSAQCFRWVETERGFGAVFDGEVVWLRQDENASGKVGFAGRTAPAKLEILTKRRGFEGCSQEWLGRYLDLDRDYAAIVSEYEEFPAARRAFDAFPGLRVLRQPPWETLVSFILSANNNVPRIRSLVLALSRAFGTEVDGLFGFPTAEAIAAATDAELRALGVGYRAPYLIETASAVCEGFPLDSLCDMQYEEAHALLTSLKGVGDKVADCVLLFGCGHTEAFPVDVWVERLMQNWFGEKGSRRVLAARGRERFGKHGGILQQFLFHAARIGEFTV